MAKLTPTDIKAVNMNTAIKLYLQGHIDRPTYKKMIKEILGQS